MPYMIYPERKLYAEGLQDAIAEFLKERFGDAGQALMGDITPIMNIDTLRALVPRIASAPTVDAVRDYVRSLTPGT